jgi:NADH:ubiquinone oxidoreductase subunit F (NADH-binding)/(2Fe-2S) ferredoxin
MTPKTSKTENSVKVDWSNITLTKEQLKSAKRIANTKPIIFIGMGTCGLAAGSQDTYNTFMTELQKYKIDAEIVPVGCLGSCFCEPIVDIKMPGKARVVYQKITKEKVIELIQRTLQTGEIIQDWVMGQYSAEGGDTKYEKIPKIEEFHYFKNQKRFVLSRCGVINPNSFEEYLAVDNGYVSFGKALEDNNPQAIIDVLKTAGLRGRGGAGFPTSTKWELCRQAKGPDEKKYVIMNADEGDPGSFQNKTLLESDPFSAIEGMSIMAFAIGAQKGYIYCRAEYPLAIVNLNKAIKIAYEKGLLGKDILGSSFSFDLVVKAGAGAFVCGEETALIESIEGKRGMPRIKPPYPATYGLFGRPSVINNVETICQVSKILNLGGDKFAKWGTEGSHGTKVFSVTGKVNYPGLIEVELGTTINDIVDIAGGILGKAKFKAAQIGGPSGGCIPKFLIETQIDYESLKKAGAMMGSGGLVIMDENTCMVDTARFFMEFITKESCGKCIPCREGTKRILETLEKLVKKPKSDLDVVDRMKSIIGLEKLCSVIKDTALCGLGNSAPNPVLTTLNYFHDEYEAHLYEDKCPSKTCQGLLKFTIDTNKCVGCGLCRINCPTEAILGEKKAAHYVVQEKCIKCGLCRTNCKFDAVVVD